MRKSRLAHGLPLLLWVLWGCGGPQKAGKDGAVCFRDDDCVLGLVCAIPAGKTERVCTGDVGGLISTVDAGIAYGGAATAGTAGSAAGGAAYGGAANGGAANGGAANGGAANGGAANGGMVSAQGGATASGGASTAGTSSGGGA